MKNTTKKVWAKPEVKNLNVKTSTQQTSKRTGSPENSQKGPKSGS